jgi:hypothetical protein
MRIERAGLRAAIGLIVAAAATGLAGAAMAKVAGQPEDWQINMQEMVTELGRDVAAFHTVLVWLIAFDFPEGHPAARLAPVSPLSVPAVMWADVTFTYSMGRVIRDYLQDA